MSKKTPIIFIGMHRSGTSMLGRLLESLGLFAGTWKDRNNEAVFFQQLNHWIMAQCGARWDIPQAMHYLWENEELFTCVEEYVRYLLDSPRAIHFLGIRRYLTTGGIAGLNIPWGWKDPRNTFTLPLWLRIFPEAKIIYIKRHGVDVAQSLRVRSQKGLYQTTRKYKRYQFIIPYRPKKGGFIESPRCASLEGGFSLWKEYVMQVKQVLGQLPRHQVLKLRYEQVLEDPIPYLLAGAEFCGLDVARERVEALTADINGGRAYAFLKDSELREFASCHRATLIEGGYQ